MYTNVFGDEIAWPWQLVQLEWEAGHVPAYNDYLHQFLKDMEQIGYPAWAMTLVEDEFGLVYVDADGNEVIREVTDRALEAGVLVDIAALEAKKRAEEQAERDAMLEDDYDDWWSYCPDCDSYDYGMCECW